MSSGGARHPAGGPRHLNPVPFPALCLASPRVLCGRLTLQWTRSSRLAPRRWTQLWTSGEGQRLRGGRAARSPFRPPGCWAAAGRGSGNTHCERGLGGRRRGGVCSAGTPVRPALASRNVLAPGPVPPPTFTAQIAPRQVIFMEISRRNRKRPIAH